MLLLFFFLFFLLCDYSPFCLARFLQHQVFAANQTAADCHFFNTFFYKKLIEAVSYKVGFFCPEVSLLENRWLNLNLMFNCSKK